MKKFSQLCIAVLCGGRSPEREVSLASGRAVEEALRNRVRRVHLLDTGEAGFVGRLLGMNPDCAFIALHGSMGEDGVMQGFLQTLGIPYTGSGVLSSAVCMNKIVTKKILSYHNIPTPGFVELRRGEEIVIPFNFPCVVKPADLGSTIGIAIVKDRFELESSVKECYNLSEEVFIEEYIKGVEVTVSIIGNEQPSILPVIQIETDTGFYDFEAKYTKGKSRHVIPPALPSRVFDRVEADALSCYKALHCSGLARLEMIVKSGVPYILDVNTIPGLTSTSLLPDSARADGLAFDQLCCKIISLALEKWASETEQE